jgi:hypothetical protein
MLFGKEKQQYQKRIGKKKGYRFGYGERKTDCIEKYASNNGINEYKSRADHITAVQGNFSFIPVINGKYVKSSKENSMQKLKIKIVQHVGYGPGAHIGFLVFGCDQACERQKDQGRQHIRAFTDDLMGAIFFVTDQKGLYHQQHYPHERYGCMEMNDRTAFYTGLKTWKNGKIAFIEPNEYQTEQQQKKISAVVINISTRFTHDLLFMDEL